ncbi:MAG: hypothetical protein CVU47_00465 [Chloroflexi bacterium HGW-Chloroflexi-9]|nr:MAG: hypothetical protein CVU47_00465 [Chloroflexi bacterium HGW-Chloroflexi-9]
MRNRASLSTGAHNIGAGLIFLAGFMVMGFVLIYLRDFAPDAEEWAASYAEGTHFETRLAHVHGALFSLVNIVIGLLLPHMPGTVGQRSAIGGLTLAGLLMPLGILAEVLFGLPPILVIVGGVSILAGTLLAGVVWVRHRCFGASTSEALNA